MSGPEPLVLLPAYGAAPAETAALAAALEVEGHTVLVPDFGSTPAETTLADRGLRVLAEVSASGAEAAVLVGTGLGAVVALEIAAAFPRRVGALVLSTSRDLAATQRRSLGHAVTAVLPAELARRLRVGPRRVLELLDLTRPVDYAEVAGRVTSPTTVLIGEHDLANRRPSAELARRVRGARLVRVSGNGPGGRHPDPDAWAAAISAALGRAAPQ